MDDPQNYAKALEERLEAKRERLDAVDLQNLGNAFKVFQASFRGLSQVLLKKGIIHEDPYKFEMKISEVANPTEGPFIESDKIDQMSLRISQFDSYLEFLNNYYQFSCEFLTMGRIKRMLGLSKYFNFSQFSDSSTSLNTKALAELVGMVKKGSDQLSSGIIADSVGQLDKATREILAVLKELTNYHRELYKLQLRQIVMPGLNLDASFVITHREEALRTVKRKFSEISSDSTFYPELVEEALLEDFTSDGSAMREAVLKRLEVQVEKKVEKAKERSFKSTLLDGVRVIASAAYPIEDALGKLGENSALFELRNNGFMARLGKMIRKVFKPEDKGIRYTIEIPDPITSQRSTEELDFVSFSEELSKKARSLASLLQRGGPSFKRLESMNEDQAYKFLVRNIEELQRAHKVLSALDDFFKETALVEERQRVKNIKIELTTLKGALIKANQKKHEFVSQREELEQMKRLGIRDVSP
jgi:hypothetical protein